MVARKPYFWNLIWIFEKKKPSTLTHTHAHKQSIDRNRHIKLHNIDIFHRYTWEYPLSVVCFVALKTRAQEKYTEKINEKETQRKISTRNEMKWSVTVLPMYLHNVKRPRVQQWCWFNLTKTKVQRRSLNRATSVQGYWTHSIDTSFQGS